jgi:hypothetical protein
VTPQLYCTEVAASKKSPALLYRSCRIKKVSSSTVQKLPHQKSPQLYYTEVAASKKSLQLYCTEVAASKKPHQKKV